MAASSTEPARFDSAAKVLTLTPEQVRVFEGQPVLAKRGVVPGVSGWSFSGARRGETSDLFDTDDAYFLARLDSLEEGGIQPFEKVKEEIRTSLLRRKKSESLLPQASQLAKAAATMGLEAAAKTRDIPVTTTPLFPRAGFVQGMGRLNEAIGAAFSIPVGAVGAPVVTDDGVFVIRVDRRVEATRAEWEKQKDAQRREATNAMRQVRFRSYLESLRKQANVKDKRKALNAAARQQAS